MTGHRRLMHRLGRRGAALTFFGILDLAIAASLVGPVAPTTRAAAELMSPWAWAGLWASVAALCFVGAWVRWDHYAFTAAIAMKVIWSGEVLASWLLYDAQRGWLGAVVWAAFAAFIAVIAGWPEPVNVLQRQVLVGPVGNGSVGK